MAYDDTFLEPIVTNKYLIKLTLCLLDQVQFSPERAQTVAAQSAPNNRHHYLFDYKKANEDLNTMRAGIDRSTQPSRAQLLDYGKVSGDYTRGRPLWR